MRKWLGMRSLFLIAALAANSMSVRAEGFDHAILNRLLEAHVQPLRGAQATEVDYAALATERSRLKEYLAALASVERARFDAWPKADQLAFLINAYNAWTVELILTAYPKLRSIKDLGSWLQSPWQKRFIVLLGESRSLDDIEHGLIRGSDRYNDPRVHFALNCASIGCPALRAEAYVGDRLESQLEEGARLFLADRTRNRLQGDALGVSSLFKWYRQDFERDWRGALSLGQFLSLYGQALGLTPEQGERLASGKIPLEFLDYDWKLNDAGKASR